MFNNINKSRKAPTLHSAHPSSSLTSSSCHSSWQQLIQCTRVALLPPEILLLIFGSLTTYQQRRLAAQVCRNWRHVVQQYILSISDKEFPTSPMDGPNWGNPATIRLAEPRILQWQLGPYDIKISEDELRNIKSMTPQEYCEYQKRKMEGEAQTIDLVAKLKLNGQQIINFRRSPTDLSQMNSMQYQYPGTYFQHDYSLLADYWDHILRHFEQSKSPFSNSEDSTALLGYVVKELRFSYNCVRNWHVIPHIARGLSVDAMIKILRIDIGYSWDLLYLLTIMDALPCLEELCVEQEFCGHRRWTSASKKHFFTQE
ncbi:hypothetical protein FBU30_007085 [Linnemannia zychae]|nr:hypothetical protein FBU30_007085 [Linnemannia zychae]